MAGHRDQWPKAEGTAPRLSPDPAAGGAIRNFILFTAGILLLVAWHLYDAFKHPEFRSTHLLKAALFSLLAVLFWVHRLLREGLAFKPTRGAHWMAAFYPLLVLAGFAWAQFDEGRRQTVQQDRALKHQAWQQEVQRQRELTHQASEDLRNASTKHAQAFKESIDSSEQLKTADGKPAFRITPDAARKVEEAKEGFTRALERYRAESERLLRLEQQSSPH